MNEIQTQRSANAFVLSNVMAGLEGTIVATALPAIVSSLHDIQLMSWIVTAFMLLMAISAPIWTKLAERFGYKQIFIIGTLVFTISSALSGLSLSMPMLIVAHAVMGIGSGAMQQLPFVIYGFMFQPNERRIQVGNAVAAYSIAAIIGPLIGGLIVDSLGWRCVFFINVPIGLFMLWVISRNFKLDNPAHKKPIDFLGSSLLSAAVITLMLAFQFMGEANANLSVVISLVVISILFFIGFFLAERRAKDPIVPLHLFSNRSLMAKNAVMFLQYGFFGFYSNYLPVWGQGVYGTTALIGGMILIPSAVTLMLGSRLANPLLRHFSEKFLVAAGMGLMLLGDILLVILAFPSSIVWLFVASSLLGFSFGVMNPVLSVAVQETVAPQNIGAATAMNALIRTLGTTLILSGLSVSLNQTFAAAVSHNHQLTINLLNMISDSTMLHLIPSALVEPLRYVLYTGLHNLSVISLAVIGLAIVINFLDPWKTAKR